MKIVFIGTGKFGAMILEQLAQSKFKPDFLICAHDKPVGRKQNICVCPTKEVATKYNLAIAEFNTLKGKEEFFENLNPDLIIVADTNFILPKEILEIPKLGCLNIHPSLLPKYRGSSPIQSALLVGDEETGVTIILMDEKIDHGDIVTSCALQIEKNETFEELRNRLAGLGAELLIDTLPEWIEGTIQVKEQNHNEATLTKRLTKKDGQIDWLRPAIEIDCQVRALNPWPGTYTFFEHQEKRLRFKILEAKVYKLKPQKERPGEIIKLDNKKMAIVCGQGLLILNQVHIEGKNIMTGEAFLNGYREIKQLID